MVCIYVVDIVQGDPGDPKISNFRFHSHERKSSFLTGNHGFLGHPTHLVALTFGNDDTKGVT
jgi:hypothetical protein